MLKILKKTQKKDTLEKGVTLIEIVVAIVILAILGLIAISFYSKTQMYARDSKRKQDLRALVVALELYKQANGRYPSPIDTHVSYSHVGGEWIPGLASYINELPQAPTNDIPGELADPADSNNMPGYIYEYTACNSATGYKESYELVARLENPNDKDINGATVINPCEMGEEGGQCVTATSNPQAYCILGLSK